MSSNALLISDVIMSLPDAFLTLDPLLPSQFLILKLLFHHHLLTDRRDDRSIRQQCRNMYSRGNTIIRNFKHCSDAVKCQLFKSFCTSFYCASLWSSYTIESLRHLKVAYNRIFRILMGLHHRARMSENFIKRGLDPFKVIIRKLSWSFRCRVLQSDNILLKTIVNSMYFMWCKLSRKWNAAILNLK